MNVSAAERCAFVKNTPDCDMDDGFINYLQVAFCLLPPNLTPLTVTLCVRSVWGGGQTATLGMSWAFEESVQKRDLSNCWSVFSLFTQ